MRQIQSATRIGSIILLGLLAGCGSDFRVSGPSTQASASVSSGDGQAAAPPRQETKAAAVNPDPSIAGPTPEDVPMVRASRPSRGAVNNPTARFLDQATFGANAADVAALNALIASKGSFQAGLSQWIDDQMNPAVTPATAWYDVPTIPTDVSSNQLCGNTMSCVQIEWFQNAIQRPDQLRQRVAFALGQIWVISGITVNTTDSMVQYQRILNNDAFLPYDTLMKDVSRSSGMGFYLDMGNSDKPAGGNIANENYARELMQLFTLGVYQLNDDGTYLRDGNGNTQATYSEADVQALAKALTGWTYKRLDGQSIWNQSFRAGTTDRVSQMVAMDTHHDTTAKTYFAGGQTCNLGSGQSASPELDAALACIFNHPNLPPFVVRQLIQHLVASNPSPAYIQRVVAVFKDDGTAQHVRGNLGAVVKAILLDPEARLGDDLEGGDLGGHLSEPVLYMTRIVRGLCGSSGACYSNATPYNFTGGSMTNVARNLPTTGANVSQNVLFAPSVFNYFAPDYTINSLGLYGPEFQILTSATSPLRANFADTVVRNNLTGSGIDITSVIATYAALAGTPDQLAGRLDQDFLYGQMNPSTKQAIINTISAMPGSTGADLNYRVKMALYLTLTSQQNQVIH